MPLSNRLAAEFFGTLWLVLGGCGSAVLACALTAALAQSPSLDGKAVYRERLMALPGAVLE